MQEELLYRLALTQVPGLGPVHARLLIERFGNAAAVFKAKKKELGAVEGIGEVRARQVKGWNDFSQVEKELLFLEQHCIRPLFITDAAYPQRLLHCYDAPVLLYYRGMADLNNTKIISIIGTRNHTPYGKWVTEQLVQTLQPLQPLIVSGLAFGIDAIAHKASLQQQLPTVGVLAHGFDTLYPMQHKTLAREMLVQGGLLSEFKKGTKPDKHNFPRRNRIVAGMADAIVVIETDVKGGSMITAGLACSYNRDVFAVPGKITDTKSTGCLQLIHQNKAILFTGGEQLINIMGWQEKKKIMNKQRELFTDLSANEQKIISLLKEKECLHIDELSLQSGITTSAAAAAILNLEIQQLIYALPGKQYRLIS